MLAGEAGPFIESVAADLAQVTDPQLKSWYQTEMSLTPEYKEATTIQERLAGLSDSLSWLIDRSTEPDTLDAPDATELLQAESLQLELAEIDEYVTPQQKKRKTVLAWLDTCLDSHEQELAKVQLEPKRSRREKQEGHATRRFAKNFETFGPDDNHIVYDPEALAVVLEHLDQAQPGLTEMVLKNCESYMHKNGVEFAKNYNSFARLIQQSTNDEFGAQFDRILTAIYDKVPMLSDPEQAVSLFISLAHASLEQFAGKDVWFFNKVAAITAFKNDIIRRKSEYIAATNGTAKTGLEIPALLPLMGDLWNARQVNFQFRTGFLVHHQELPNVPVKDGDHFTVSLSLGRKYGTIEGAESMVNNMLSYGDFFQRPQHAEQFEIWDLRGDAPMQLANKNVSVPEVLKPYYYASELYKKRKERVSPRGLAHDILRNSMSVALKTPARNITVFDIPISPGLSISFGTNLPTQDLLHANGKVIDAMLREFSGNQLTAGFYTAAMHEQIAKFGFYTIDVSLPDLPAVADVIIRPSVPDDILFMGGPYSALITSIRNEADNFTNTERNDARHNEKLAAIKQQRNHYPGRRPLHFKLPQPYHQNGLQAIELRQHPDRRHFYVSALHNEGRMEFVVDENFRIDDPVFVTEKSAIVYAFEHMVVSLAAEWICKPVVATSEGTVSVHDQKSKVNLGFLRHLPVNHNPSLKQQSVFAREQHGNLIAESRRRQAYDPDGLGRSSTYVRVNFDPSKPPLEVYYDHNVLKTN